MVRRKKKVARKAVAKKMTRGAGRPGRKPLSKKAMSSEMLLVGTKTKEALKSYGYNVASDAIEGLNALVHKYIAQAASRAEANGRKTIRPHDFIAG